MPLTMRPIPHALNLGAPEIYGQGPTGQGTQGTQVLEDVNMASMVGTLAQLGALATYAQDMFDGLFQTADSLANQVSAASTRCSRLLQALPEAERRTAEAIRNGTGIDDNAAVEAIKAERQHAKQVESEAAAKVFLPEAMPRWLVERYHSPEVARVPDLHLIDAVLSPEEKNLLTKDGLDSCALRYSNPQFFYQEWYRLELGRQEKSVREKKQKKEERKRRKAAAKAAGARAGGEQDEESARVPRPARKSLSDWRGKFAMAGLGIGSGTGAASRGGSARSSAGDVSSLVGNEKVVVQKREAYGDKFYRQEEEFADTGYQITPSDPGVTGTAVPTGVQQLGALTAEDFNRKSGALKEDGRRLFKPQSARAGELGAQPTASQPPRPQQRPPPPQAPAARPGTSPLPPPPPAAARPPALPQPPPVAHGEYSAATTVASGQPLPGPGTAPPVPPPPPTASRPPPPRAAPPPPPPPPAARPAPPAPPVPPVPHVRRPSYHEPMVAAVPEPEVMMDEAPSRPSYETWGVDQPPPPQAAQEFEYVAPPVAPPAPPLPVLVSSDPPPPPPMPPSRPPVAPPLPPVHEASQSGQPPPPPPLPPPLPSTGHAPPPPPLPPASFGTNAGGASMLGDLLASITDGKKLKKVERTAPEAGGGGGGSNELLDAIRSGAQLKKVDRPQAPAAETSNPLFGDNPGIYEMLAVRRKYLEAESEDSDSDEDSDWDED